MGPFSDKPANTIPEGSDPQEPYDVSQLPGTKPGLVWSLTVNPDTVVLTFDASANPITVADPTQPFNFFLLATATSKNVTGWVQHTSGEGQFRELGSATDRSQTFGICS